MTFSVIASLTYYFYTVYGYEFLYETYLYHFVRKDNRHNFSIYWYMMYQLYDEPSSKLIAILLFIPQWGLIVVTAFLFFFDVFFATFIQTLAFVSFNKVITSQYYLWYFTLVPLAFLHTDLRNKKGKVLLVVALYFLGQLPFSFFAYKFEFQGEHTLAEI
jgi:phosphatidylinositol glycan class M